MPFIRSSPGASGAGSVFNRWAAVAVAAVLVAAASAPATAQQGAVGGTVFSAETLQPLPGANVVVVGTNRGTITNADGRFLLPGLTGTEVTLRVSMLGYRAQTVQARPGDLNLRITLETAAIELDRIVVTGTAGQQTKRALGNTVAEVNAEDIVDKAPVNTMAELLNGRAAGVTIIQTTGMLGGGNRVRIRGSSSFSLSNEPLVYIDGVRVNNAQATGPISQAFGSRPISRWNDLNPEDIESIEIIKGPAAATLYGTEASNGVIQIITKKGRAGGTTFNLSIKQGTSSWDPAKKLWTNYYDVGGDGTIESLNIVDLENQRLDNCTRGPTDYYTKCPVHSIWRRAYNSNYDLSASGGSEVVHYYVSAGLENATGVDWSNNRKMYNGRLNLTATPTDKIDITGSVGYVTGRTGLGFEAGGGGATWTTFYARPDKLDAPNRGFWSYTPEAYQALFNVWQDVQRSTISLTMNHRPAPWFSHRLNIGRDYTSVEDVELMNHDERWLDLTSFADRGYKEMWDRGTTYTTVDYSGTFKFPVKEGIESNTSVGGQMYRRDYGYVYAYGEGFPVPGLTSMAATTQNRENSEYAVHNVTVGAYIQEQVALNNRLFLTAAVRTDDNSAFGSEFNLVTYPKVSASWVMSDEPFWSFTPVSTLKLRAAYGQSGQQPEQFVALKTFDPTAGPGGVGTVTPLNLGNPNLGPERGTELELGFDAGLFNERMGIEFTFYDQHTYDAILEREIAPSTGFYGSQYVNAGEISNTGIELLVRGTPWRTEHHGLDLTFNLSTNANKVISLGDVTDQNYVSAGGYNRHEIGYPVGAWFGPKVVSADMDASGAVSNVMCDDGNGGTVACSSAPDVYLGRVVPKMEGGFSGTLTMFDRFRLYTQLDFKTGFSKLDGNYRVRCWFFAECRENWYPTEFDPVTIAEIDGGYVSGLIDRADFLKLREVSLSYTLPESWANYIRAHGATITIAGRNLGTWTKFKGLEPESTFNGGSRGGNFSLWEQNVLPQMTQFVATFNVTF